VSDKGYEPSKEEVFKESVRVTNEVGWRGRCGGKTVLKVSDALRNLLKAGRSGRLLTAGQGVRTFAPAC